MKIIYILLSIYAGKFGQDMEVKKFDTHELCVEYAAKTYGYDNSTDWVCFPSVDGPITEE